MAHMVVDGAAAKAARLLMIQRARTEFWAFARLVYPEISPDPFIEAWHLRALAWRLGLMVDGQRCRQLIAAPPRHFKSYITSVAFPAFLLGLRPTTKVICASYNEDLALSFAKQSRQIMTSAIYAKVFPETVLASVTPAAHELRTKQGGYRYASSVGGTLTGLGADVLIVDDPIKTDESGSLTVRQSAHDWLTGSALTRFDDEKHSVAIVTHQRQHVDDLIGRLKATGGWESLDLPAQAAGHGVYPIGMGKTRTVEGGEILFPERFDKKVLSSLRAEIGQAAYAAQYLQAPAPPGGGLFKFAKIKRFDLPQKVNKKDYEALILSIDPGVSTAPGADYTAITVWAVRGFDLRLVYASQGRWSLPEQIEVVRKYANAVSAILIEHSHPGISLVQMLEKEGIGKTLFYHPKFDKQVRAQTAALAIERGRVWFPKEAVWLDMVQNQLAAFPNGKNDDIVDSMSQVFCKLQSGFPTWVELSAYKPDTVVNMTIVYGK